MRIKKIYYFVINSLFVTGLFYAIGNFATTSKKTDFLQRRLWAYESWIIFAFYGIFLFLILLERDFKLPKVKAPGPYTEEFKKILIVNLVLLVFPWGIFLILGPSNILDLFGLNSIYWRVLGVFSLLGAGIYYFPYRFYRKKLSYYIILFGAIDNLAAGLILSYLFIKGRVPLAAWSSAPLLFYFAYFFMNQAQKYKQLRRKITQD